MSAAGAAIPRGLDPRALALFGVVATVAVSAYPLAFARERKPSPYLGHVDDQISDRELPIVIPYTNSFVQRIQYSPDRNRYRYVLDWPSAIRSESGTFPPQEYHHMEALRNRFSEVFGKTVVDADEFLKANRRFLVIEDPGFYDFACRPLLPWYSFELSVDWQQRLQCPQFLEARILRNPAYTVREIQRLPDWTAVLLVERTD